MGRALAMRITESAYTTIALHALKYTDCAICGVLVGQPDNIVRAIPLLHGQVSLSPMLEVAFAQVEAMVEEEGHGEIVGYYQANSHYLDETLSDSAQRVANKIRSFCADACMLIVRNSALGGIVNDPSKLFAVYQWEPKGKEWKHGLVLEAPENVGAPIMQAFAAKKHIEIADFDDHLEQPNLDWLHNDECVVNAL